MNPKRRGFLVVNLRVIEGLSREEVDSPMAAAMGEYSAFVWEAVRGADETFEARHAPKCALHEK